MAVRGSTSSIAHEDDTPDKFPDLMVALIYPTASKGDYHYQCSGIKYAILNLHRGPLGVGGSCLPFLHRRTLYGPSRCDPLSRDCRHRGRRYTKPEQDSPYRRVIHRYYSTTVSVQKKNSMQSLTLTMEDFGHDSSRSQAPLRGIILSTNFLAILKP